MAGWLAAIPKIMQTAQAVSSASKAIGGSSSKEENKEAPAKKEKEPMAPNGPTNLWKPDKFIY